MPLSLGWGAFCYSGVMDDFGRPGVDLWKKDRERIAQRIPPRWGQYISVGDGWMKIVIDLDAELAKLYPDYEIHQVKEKFGTLRFYCDVPYYDEDGNRTPASYLIDEAEGKSATTCEECGGPGEPRYGGWVKTLCDKCSAEREARRAQS